MGALEMKIKLWPDLIEWPLSASVEGDVITVNGENIDLSGITEGYRLPGYAVGNKFFVETEFVERIDGELNFTLRLPIVWDSPEKYRNPSKPIIIDILSGSIPFPDTSSIQEPQLEVESLIKEESENGGFEQA